MDAYWNADSHAELSGPNESATSVFEQIECQQIERNFPFEFFEAD